MLPLVPVYVVLQQAKDFGSDCIDGRIRPIVAPLIATGGIVFLATEFVGFMLIAVILLPIAPLAGALAGELLALKYQAVANISNSNIQVIRRHLNLQDSVNMKLSNDFAVYEYEKDSCLEPNCLI